MARRAARTSYSFGLALVVVACAWQPGKTEKRESTLVPPQEPTAFGAVAPVAVPAPSDVAAPPADAARTPSGLAHKLLQAGMGREHPHAYDRVTLRYTGWTSDGAMFDSTVQRGRPEPVDVAELIDGWSEGVQLMVEGERRMFWIPEGLAYKGRPGPPPGMLVYDVELVSIERRPVPPAVPSDVAAPPVKAIRTESGLASTVLKVGAGTQHPTVADAVEIHYTGWTRDGRMFDNSVAPAAPARFRLSRVIAGWSEGIVLMVEGEKRRFWIPEALAYRGREGAPAGMLVFDVELVKIVGVKP